MDFELLPPEVNSGRMYSGPGSGPMLAAVAGWEGLAAELHGMAAGYESAVSELGARWQGPAAAAMAAAATPYTVWLHATASRAEQTAAQGRAAAAAYEAAFAATVPPPVVAANRSLLMALIATNFLGQNTPAIATTEAHYAEMWAQDATAMYGYADSSAIATRLNLFTPPPRTTNPAGSNLQTQLARLMSAVPRGLRNFSTAGRPARTAASTSSGFDSALSGATTFMSQLTGPYSPLGHLGVAGGWWLSFGQILGLAQNLPGAAALLSGAKPITGALAPLSSQPVSMASVGPADPAGGAVTATMSGAGLIGGLSVPSSWASAVPAIKAITPAIGAAAGDAPPAAMEHLTGVFGGAAGASAMAGRALDVAVARPAGGMTARTISTAATQAGATAADGIDATVTILVIPPPER